MSACLHPLGSRPLRTREMNIRKEDVSRVVKRLGKLRSAGRLNHQRPQRPAQPNPALIDVLPRRPKRPASFHWSKRRSSMAGVRDPSHRSLRRARSLILDGAAVKSGSSGSLLHEKETTGHGDESRSQPRPQTTLDGKIKVLEAGVRTRDSTGETHW